jgi:hypothetical protein
MLACVAAAAPPPSRAVRECASCHPAQARPHPATSMAHAMELVPECDILKSHPVLTFAEGKYSYRIERKGDTALYTVSDGEQTLTASIGWSFGLGVAGQTYVFEKDGTFYESRVSYYSELNGLDLTMGAKNLKPVNILQAAGRAMGRDEKIRCFGCHSTNATQGKELTLDTLLPGVQCERCHGSSEDHLRGIRQGNPTLAKMQDLRQQSTEDLSNFCGQCHRTWAEIAGAGTLGIANIRFQPYRLTSSKCYDTEDSRISCVACHDPHQELSRADQSYDAKCQACHGGEKHGRGKKEARVCKVAPNNCVSCHMPKLEMPGSHHKFTDHLIRVVRANEPYPD